MPSSPLSPNTVASPALSLTVKVESEGARAQEEREDEDVDNVVRSAAGQVATGRAPGAAASLHPPRKLRG